MKIRIDETAGNSWCPCFTRRHHARGITPRLRATSREQEDAEISQRRRRIAEASLTLLLFRASADGDVSMVARRRERERDRLSRFAGEVSRGKIGVHMRRLRRARVHPLVSYVRSSPARSSSDALVHRAPFSRCIHIRGRAVRCLCKSKSFLLGQNRFHLVVSCLRSPGSNAVAFTVEREVRAVEHEEVNEAVEAQEEEP